MRTSHGAFVYPQSPVELHERSPLQLYMAAGLGGPLATAKVSVDHASTTHSSAYVENLTDGEAAEIPRRLCGGHRGSDCWRFLGIYLEVQDTVGNWLYVGLYP